MTTEAPELELAFSTETIVGWRLWRLERGIDRKRTVAELATELLAAERGGEERPVERLFEYRLRSLTQPLQWPARQRLESNCAAAPHGQPQPSCECGIVALRSCEAAEAMVADYAFNAPAFAIGRVSCWGRVIELERGWRAQYAYPLDLTLVGGTQAMADDISDAYGVPAGVAAWTEYV